MAKKMKRKDIPFKEYVTKEKKISLNDKAIDFIASLPEVKTIEDFVDNFVPVINKLEKQFPNITDGMVKDNLDEYLSEVVCDIYGM